MIHLFHLQSNQLDRTNRELCVTFLHFLKQCVSISKCIFCVVDKIFILFFSFFFIKDEMTKSLLYDVSGSPRKEKVKTPASILGSRPNAVPNDKVSQSVTCCFFFVWLFKGPEDTFSTISRRNLFSTNTHKQVFVQINHWQISHWILWVEFQ